MYQWAQVMYNPVTMNKISEPLARVLPLKLMDTEVCALSCQTEVFFSFYEKFYIHSMSGDIDAMMLQHTSDVAVDTSHVQVVHLNKNGTSDAR